MTSDLNKVYMAEQPYSRVSITKKQIGYIEDLQDNIIDLDIDGFIPLKCDDIKKLTMSEARLLIKQLIGVVQNNCIIANHETYCKNTN